jgi:hypothetical protein
LGGANGSVVICRCMNRSVVTTAQVMWSGVARRPAETV